LHIATRIALAYGVSLAAACAVQLVLTLLPDARWLDRAFVPLAVWLLPITAVFAGVLWRHPTSRALGWTAIIVVVAMIVLAAALYVLAVRSVTPGVGGNVMVAAALIADLFFILPALVAPPIHWLVLRPARGEGSKAN
jgi:hypothetical protein